MAAILSSLADPVDPQPTSACHTVCLFMTPMAMADSSPQSDLIGIGVGTIKEGQRRSRCEVSQVSKVSIDTCPTSRREVPEVSEVSEVSIGMCHSSRREVSEV